MENLAFQPSYKGSHLFAATKWQPPVCNGLGTLGFRTDPPHKMLSEYLQPIRAFRTKVATIIERITANRTKSSVSLATYQRPAMRDLVSTMMTRTCRAAADADPPQKERIAQSIPRHKTVYIRARGFLPSQDSFIIIIYTHYKQTSVLSTNNLQLLFKSSSLRTTIITMGNCGCASSNTCNCGSSCTCDNCPVRHFVSSLLFLA